MLRAPGKLCSFSYVLFVFLLFYVLDVVSITVYDRDTLLNIGSSVAQRKPDFEFLNAGGLFTDTASEPFVWVAKSTRRRRRRKRGKRAGVLVRLRRRAFRPPLPTILLANVQSLDNKLCELRARISYQRETRDCCVICLTETWMSAIVPDSAIELTGFSVHRSDRTKELTGKSRGGGVCFYINNLWCDERNIHSIKSFCSPDLEFHTLLCRPFWLPREFTAIIITAVYITPQATLVAKLQTLGLNRSLCSWILDFLTGRSQVVRMGNNTSSPLILNTGAPQGCVLSPLLYSLYTHDCTATHSSNVIVKFADDTTVIGLITDNDETAYREEVSTLTKWCQENHLSLNIDKTKELVVDYRRQSREHTPITIDKTPVERVSSFKFLGVHITEDLTWSAHTDAVLKKAHQRLFFLRRLRKFGTSPRILRSFYTCTMESILTGCITAWFGNSTAGNRRALQRVVRTACHIVGGELPSLQDIYTRRCTRKARRIIKDSSHPSHRLLSLLPSGRRFRSIRSHTSRLRDSFFPQAIRLMNSHK